MYPSTISSSKINLQISLYPIKSDSIIYIIILLVLFYDLQWRSDNGYCNPSLLVFFPSPPSGGQRPSLQLLLNGFFFWSLVMVTRLQLIDIEIDLFICSTFFLDLQRQSVDNRYDFFIHVHIQGFSSFFFLLLVAVSDCHCRSYLMFWFLYFFGIIIYLLCVSFFYLSYVIVYRASLLFLFSKNIFYSFYEWWSLTSMSHFLYIYLFLIFSPFLNIILTVGYFALPIWYCYW